MPARMARRRRAFRYFPNRSSISRAWASAAASLNSQADYDAHYAPGHFWMTLLDGRHVSSDIAVVDGEPRWWRHVTGKPAGEGTFDYWIVHAEPDAGIEAHCGAWVRKNLAGYTGMLNLETIGEKIIEAHLRFADQWPDLYGPGWVDAVVGLYERGDWDFCDDDRSEGYSVVLFGPHGRALPASAAGDLVDGNQAARPASPACKSHSTMIARRNAMPCRPAVSALLSSTVSISRGARGARAAARSISSRRSGRGTSIREPAISLCLNAQPYE